MKITNEVLEVTRSGTFKEHKYRVANTAQMFELLSSKVYADVVLAVVRELSTNASDSHMDAGCPDKPFDVHLPNALEPWFSIRDYGTGMSPDNVENVYTTFGESTRTLSNDFTGCLGIGSKSPFAYNDQFTIISNWNGRKYTYSAFKDEDSCFTLAVLSEVDTDEPNGLEIRISTKPGDANAFVKAAQRVYTFFKVRPNVVGASLRFDDVAPEMTTSEFSLYITHDSMILGRINVVMGQVCYSVDAHKVRSPFAHNATLILNMPMGSVSIAASREEIQYDPKTIANVNAALTAAGTAVRTELDNRVKNEGSLLHKLRALSRYRNLIQGLSVNGVSTINNAELDKYSLKTAMIKRGDKLFIQPNLHDFRAGDYIENVVFIEEDADLSQNMKNRLRQYMRTVQNGKFYLATIKDAARFAELFGVVATKLSVLPDVPRMPRGVNTRANARSKPIKLLRDDNTRNMLYEWINLDANDTVDPKDACCVPRDGNWAMWQGRICRPSEVREIAFALGFKRVYGIAVKRYDSLRAKYNIVDLSTVAKDRAEKLVAKLDTYALARFQHTEYLPSKLDVKKLAGLSTECDDMVKLCKAQVDDIKVYSKLCNVFDIKLPVAPNYQETFFKKYPLLLSIDWYSSKIDMAAVTQYVKLIEAA